MDPIDYSGAFANVQAPGQAFVQGLQGGLALHQVQMEQAQQQATLARKQQFQSDVAALGPSPSPADIASLSAKYPEYSEQFKRSFDMLTPTQQQAKIAAAAPVHAAALSGEYGIAAQQLRQQADALENSGDTQQAQQTRAMADLIEKHPETATTTTGMLLASAMGPDKYSSAFKDIGAEGRAAAEAPYDLGKKQGDADEAKAKATQERLGILGQKAGALAGIKGVKGSQAATMFQALASQGVISKDELPNYVAGIPQNDVDVPAYLNSIRDQGIKPDDQKKFTTPTAGEVLQSDTTKRGQDIAAKTAGDRLQFDKDQAESGDDVTNFTPEAIDNAAKRYNLDGTLPPMGMGAAASAGRTKILNRAAELAAGIDGTDQRRSQLTTKQGIANQGKAIAAFNTGKEGKAVRSFNVLLSHLDTLDSLSDALNNGNVQLVNRLGNAYNKATGNPAPTNFDSVKHIVADEVVKAITGGAGALGDREESARAINGANSPAQLKGVIENIKKLSVGQLGGLEQQYKASTGLDDFEHYLTPAARLMRTQHSEGAAAAPRAQIAPALPSGWSVEVH